MSLVIHLSPITKMLTVLISLSKFVIVFGNLNKSQMGQLSGLKFGQKLYWGVF